MPDIFEDGDFTSSTTISNVLSGFKILIVDDNPVNLEIASAALQDSGAIVRIAEDGKQALQQASIESPDLVFLDLSLPDLDGIEISRMLHQLSPSGLQRLILFTAADHDVAQSARIDCKAIGIVSKPVDMDELVMAASECLAIQ